MKYEEELPGTKWVQVSTELLVELGEWSPPVRVKVVEDDAGVLDMVFQLVEQGEK